MRAFMVLRAFLKVDVKPLELFELVMMRCLSP